MCLIIVIIVAIKVMPLLGVGFTTKQLILTKRLVVQVIKLLTNGENALSLLSNYVLALSIRVIKNRG